MANRFMDMLEEQGVVVFDGAVGTMLFEHGVFINRSFDQLNLTSPDLVRDIHSRYLAAGAMVVETNTFGANRFKLQPFDLHREVQEINRRGALIAREAAGDKGFVAGSVGPLGVRIEPWGPTSLDEARAAFREQIDALLGAGVDAVVLETFTDLAEMRQALAAFAEARAKLGVEVPVIASMTVDREGNSLYGTEPENFGPKLESWGAEIVGLNCSVGPRPMLDTLERLRAVTTRPLSVMPNAGLPSEVDGRTIYICSPDYMANYARRFVQVGARIVGGCCGTTPEHIRAIADSIRQISGESRSMVARAATVVRRDSVPPQTVALSERSRLAAKVVKGEFVASVELAPPQGWDLDRILKSAAAVRDAGFDAVNIPDGPRASARMGSLAMAALVEREAGIETVMHYACRDRNLVGMQSDLLGAYALGLRNLLIITGDPPILGDYPHATAVFDVDAIGLTNMVHRLNTGLDLGGRSIGKPTGFLIAVGVNPTALSPDKELSRFHWKVDAGAELAITQPVFDSRQLLDFLARVDAQDRIPVLAGIWPLQSLRNAEFLANEVPGVSVPKSVLDRMAAARETETEAEEGERIAIEIMEQVSGAVQGIQVAAPFGRIQSAINVLEAARRIFDAKAKTSGGA
jgi:methionine synthase / methylenetetrahydrofolate reductase(NADPH)